jgi:hypothetical protein
MADTAVLAAQRQSGFTEAVAANHVYAPGVSWSAVIAGSFVGAALSLILLALGAGLGLSAVSPWSNMGASGSTLGTGAILWLILMQIMASSMGGYLAGRLRTKWARIHTDEVYFRDTAHGFLAWAVGVVITAAFLASAATAMVGGAAPRSVAASSPTGGQGSSAGIDSSEYFVDMLLRSNATSPNSPATNAAMPTAVPNPNDASVRREAGLIFANGLRQGYLPGADQTYLAQLVAARVGMSEPDAEKHVSDVFAADQQAADAARRAVAHSLLWIFLALLIGAFCASLAATFGGVQRDHVVMV